MNLGFFSSCCFVFSACGLGKSTKKTLHVGLGSGALVATRAVRKDIFFALGDEAHAEPLFAKKQMENKLIEKLYFENKDAECFLCHLQLLQSQTQVRPLHTPQRLV